MSNEVPVLLHITDRSQWDDQRSGTHYRALSLAVEGFIHLSTVDQVLIPANERYHAQTDLVLLLIDAEKLVDPVVFEDCYDSGIAFPHLYGALPILAVSQVIEFVPEPDGSFRLPAELERLTS